MTFKEQIKPYMYCYLGSGMLTNTYNREVVDKYAEEVEKISDEFAIGFAEWFKEYPNNQAKGFDGNRLIYPTTKELLEIYKKEKGL